VLVCSLNCLPRRQGPASACKTFWCGTTCCATIIRRPEVRVLVCHLILQRLCNVCTDSERLDAGAEFSREEMVREARVQGPLICADILAWRLAVHAIQPWHVTFNTQPTDAFIFWNSKFMLYGCSPATTQGHYEGREGKGVPLV
jgi:hypothetical protein